VATDVIYDVAAIPVLFAAAEGLLKERGLFVLVHVPRASIECELSQIRDSLEEIIASEARKNGFATSLQECRDLEAWEVLFGGDDDDRTDDLVRGEVNLNATKTRSAILRPSTLAEVWATGKREEDRPLSVLKLACCSYCAQKYYQYSQNISYIGAFPEQ